MSLDERHIDPEMPIRLQSLLDGLAWNEEFDVPPDYFENLSKTISGRLSDVEQQSSDSKSALTDVLGKPTENDWQVREDFFENQRAEIMAQIRLSSQLTDDEEFKTPEYFFDSQLKEIQSKISERPAGKMFRINARFLGYVAAAASVVIALFVLWPTKSIEETSFASRLEVTVLDLEDLEYFADEEDYYDLYFHEMAADTISTDTLDAGMNETMSEPKRNVEKLDPKTGLPLKKEQTSINSQTDDMWNELTDEDLMKYLLEEGDDELIDEMN